MSSNILNDLNKYGRSEFTHDLGNYLCKVCVNFPKATDDFEISYLLVIPESVSADSRLAVEVNNLESDELDKVVGNALMTARRLTKNLKDFSAPVLIPILPSVKIGPYYQQLSTECFQEDSQNLFHRIDLQVMKVIEKAKQIIFEETGVIINDKIFMHGYSSSGVFAQRFALLHHEIIDTLCAGGASSSIPFPTTHLNYPLGIADYENLVGKKFDFESYRKIKFRYYVGGLEVSKKVNSRFDEEGNLAPMHDMSYFDRSVPYEVGYLQRTLFGKDLISRSEKEIELMKQMGLDIEQVIFEGREHNNQNGIGVNELGDQYVHQIYGETTNKKKYNHT